MNQIVLGIIGAWILMIAVGHSLPPAGRSEPPGVTQPDQDTDGDGLSNQEEAEILGALPNNPDTDGDGLLDGAEAFPTSAILKYPRQPGRTTYAMIDLGPSSFEQLVIDLNNNNQVLDSSGRIWTEGEWSGVLFPGAFRMNDSGSVISHRSSGVMTKFYPERPHPDTGEPGVYGEEETWWAYLNSTPLHSLIDNDDEGSTPDNGRSYATALNNSNQVVGVTGATISYATESEHGYIWTGQMTALPHFGVQSSDAYSENVPLCINDSGTFAGLGIYSADPPAFHGYMVRNGVTNSLGLYTPAAINNSNHVLLSPFGSTASTPHLYVPGAGSQDLALIFGNGVSVAQGHHALNNRGEMLLYGGQVALANNSKLVPIVPTGWNFAPEALNDAGIVAGRAWSSAGGVRNVLLVPAEVMVDGNHDGKMSTSDAVVHRKDAITKESPFRFWLNNDVDAGQEVDGNDWEEDDLETGNPDSQDGVITCRRDLEDFTRIWINAYQVVQVLGGSAGLTVEMEWKPMEGETWASPDGAPSIKLYKAVEAAGGSRYLTEQDQEANDQIGGIYKTSIGAVTKENVYTFPANFFNDLTEENPNMYLLFEGAAAGKGRLIVRFKKGQAVAELPPTYIELKDIKDMYEHWTVGNGAGGEPAASATRLTAFQYSSDSPEEKTYILFVHGWNMEQWEKERFAETAYKRLWLQGYKGRFGLFTWPCTNKFDGLGSALADSSNYDRGEWTAWRSASALRAKLSDLYGQYNGELNVLAHSMGNVVVGEALRLQSDAKGSQIIKTYVASQAAVPAHLYDSTLAGNLQWTYAHPDIPGGAALNYGPHTPNVYGNWCAFVTSTAAGHTQSVGKIVNFFNPNDWALAPDIWEFNQITKPDDRDLPEQLYFYVFNGDPEAPLASGVFRRSLVAYPYIPYSTLDLGGRAALEDRYEIMAFAAEARTSALGRTPLNAQIMPGVNLQDTDIWPADATPSQRNGTHGAHKWHSAQFRSTNMRQKGYWKTVLGPEAFNLQPPLSP